MPDYIAYLAYILSALPQEDSQVRTIAGYLLKNNARLILSASPEAAQYAKSAVLLAFSDSSTLVRTAAGQDIVALLGVLEPRNWPDCLGELVNMLDDPDRQEVSDKSKGQRRSMGPRGSGATILAYIHHFFFGHPAPITIA